MIRKPLQQITEADLFYLQENEIHEGVPIEYKLDLSLENRDQKSEFLSDIVSFTGAGGDLLVGVSEDEGVPTGFPGIAVADQDKLGLTIENLCRDKVEPRIPSMQMRFVPLTNGRHVLVLRIGRSWNGPHRNGYNNHFYTRNSRGKAPMDVGELRNAFTGGAHASDRIRNFRAGRLAAITAKKTPVPIEDGITMVLHIAPLAAAAGESRIDVDALQFQKNRFVPLGDTQSISNRPNLDGRVTFYGNGGDPTDTYTQLFRHGFVESVVVFLPAGEDKVLSGEFEDYVDQACTSFIPALADLDFDGPALIMLSFLNMKGAILHIGRNNFTKAKLVEDELVLPDVMLEPGGDVGPILSMLYRMVWNGFGRTRPENP